MNVENELRKWLSDNVKKPITIQWVEPGRYGSTMGAADAILKHYDLSVSLELKIWEHKRKGIKCAMRPVQRRWHRMTMKNGGHCAVLFNLKGTGDIYLLRGDRVPLRDYACDPSSGCQNNRLVITEVVIDDLVENDIEDLLFSSDYKFWM